MVFFQCLDKSGFRITWRRLGEVLNRVELDQILFLTYFKNFNRQVNQFFFTIFIVCLFISVNCPKSCKHFAVTCRPE